MLYFLFEKLELLRSLDPLTGTFVRGAFGGLTAFVVALLFGRWFITFQLHHRILERADLSDSRALAELHQSKSRTPTMGGVIFIVGLLAATLLWARLDHRFVWLLVLTTVVLGAVGWVDDYIKLKSSRKGVAARTKLAIQILLGAALGSYLYFFPASEAKSVSPSVFVPFVSGALPLGIFFIGVVALVVAGASNAVNLTDGLDGLAMGCAVLVGIPLAVLTGLSGHEASAVLPTLPFVPGNQETSFYLFALVGSGLGFLWFNCHPAQIFMGDTGSLPLGGLLGLTAILSKQEFLFVVLGGVFVVEMLSVVLQVGSFKLLGRRVFLIAPLHHHFQFKGWGETKVTVRFWIVAAVLSMVSLMTVTQGLD